MPKLNWIDEWRFAVPGSHCAGGHTEDGKPVIEVSRDPERIAFHRGLFAQQAKLPEKRHRDYVAMHGPTEARTELIRVRVYPENWKPEPKDTRQPCGVCEACRNNQPCFDPG